MKKIGIIGGLGPESTIDYYKEIIAAFNTKYAELAYPEIIVYSANMTELMNLVTTENWSEIAEWLLERIFALHRAGAQFAAIASNTPHIVFDDIQSKSPIPLLAIVKRMVNENHIDALILGCTELPLILTESTYGIPFLNTSAIHCESIIAYCLDDADN